MWKRLNEARGQDTGARLDSSWVKKYGEEEQEREEYYGQTEIAALTEDFNIAGMHVLTEGNITLQHFKTK